MSRVLWLAAIVFAVPVPAFGQITFVDVPMTVAPAKPAAGAKNDGEKLECRMQDSTENRLGRHAVCLTKEQWAHQEQADKEMARHIQEESGEAKPF